MTIQFTDYDPPFKEPLLNKQVTDKLDVWIKGLVTTKITLLKTKDQILFEKTMTTPQNCNIPGCTICIAEQSLKAELENKEKELSKSFDTDNIFVPKFSNGSIVKALEDSGYVTGGGIYSVECTETYAGERSVLIYSDDAHRTRWYRESIFELFGTNNTAIKSGDLLECVMVDVYLESLEPGIVYQASSDSYWNGDRYNCLEFVRIAQDEQLNHDTAISAKYFRKIALE